jgi:hypothetical protein
MRNRGSSLADILPAPSDPLTRIGAVHSVTPMIGTRYPFTNDHVDNGSPLQHVPPNSSEAQPTGYRRAQAWTRQDWYWRLPMANTLLQLSFRSPNGIPNDGRTLRAQQMRPAPRFTKTLDYPRSTAQPATYANTDMRPNPVPRRFGVNRPTVWPGFLGAIEGYGGG